MRPPFAAALAVALVSSGCDRERCSLIYLHDSPTVQLTPPLSGDGTWTFDLTGDATGSCTLTLPPSDDTSGAGGAWSLEVESKEVVCLRCPLPRGP